MCDRGKLFPGSVQTPEVKNWNDKTSEDYQNLHFTITNFFANTFKNTDYGQTVITKVSSLSEARYGIRTGASNLKVSVVNIFAETTTQNETTVYNIIKNSMANSNIANYDSQSLCDYYGCVKNKDNCNNGLQCQCQDGLERPNPQVPFCVATVPAVCSSGCSSKYHKQCIIKSNTAECMCLAGYERDGRGDCQKCATGYSGVNCQDSFQMILIIVGSIAAIIIIGMAIALIVLRTKSKKNNIEEQNLIENDFQNLRLQQTTGFSNPGAEGSLFPKIRANTTSQPQNPYTNQSRLPYPDY
ncbi:mucin-13 [Erinaceus europaeus]|uniref:Mucin-13 n=1 Tax=Erinaceus europaeus TaxID=9365 RepID=A0ABM3XVY9_ERIEU|nr:mucin-13 [Erinaceus europaeus]